MPQATALKNGNMFWIEVKKHLISALIGAVLVGIPFYFTTTASLTNNANEIVELKTWQKSIHSEISEINLKLNSAINTREQIADIKADIKQLSERQDKMYDLLLSVVQKK